MGFKQIIKLICAGHAIFTIKNKKSGNHFTYKFQKPNNSPIGVYAVSVLGKEHGNWLYMFTIRDSLPKFSSTHSRTKPWDVRVKALMWFLARLKKNQVPDTVECQFATRCCRCGKRLTDVESIKANVGPECAKYIDTER